MEELGINLNYCPTKIDRDFIFECCERTLTSTKNSVLNDWYRKRREQKVLLKRSLKTMGSVVLKGVMCANAQAIAWSNKLTQDEEFLNKNNEYSIDAAITIAFAKEETKLCCNYICDTHLCATLDKKAKERIIHANEAAEKAIAFVCAGEMLHMFRGEDIFGNVRVINSIGEYWYKKIIETRNDYNTAYKHQLELEKSTHQIICTCSKCVQDSSHKENLTNWLKAWGTAHAKSIISMGIYKSFFLCEELVKWFNVQRERTRWKRMLREYSQKCAAISDANDRSAYVLRRLQSIFIRAMKMNRESMRITKQNQEESEKHRQIREKCRQDKARKGAELASKCTPIRDIKPIVGRCAEALPTESEVAAARGKKVESIRTHSQGISLAKKKQAELWAIDKAVRTEQQRCINISHAINSDDKKKTKKGNIAWKSLEST